MAKPTEKTYDATPRRLYDAALKAAASLGYSVSYTDKDAALPAEDIFHGIVFQHHLRGRTYLAPASDVARITDRAVYLAVDADAADAYEEFHQLHVSRLGLRGIFHWKHMGWTESPE